MIEEGLVQVLSADGPVAALVATRIYANVMPQNAVLPAIVYQMISAPVDETHDGDGTLYFARYQIRCWAGKKPGQGGAKVAHQLAAAVRAALKDNLFVVGSPPTEAVERVHLVNQLDGGFDPDPEAISVIVDYQIDYKEM